MQNAADVILKTTKILSENSYREYKYIPQNKTPLPNIENLKEVVRLVKAVVFPGFFRNSDICPELKEFHIGIYLEQLFTLLCEEIQKGLDFFCEEDVKENPSELAMTFINCLPEIKRLLSTDVKAVFDGDPAARNYGEVIFCYPGIQAMINYRVAHELLKLEIPVLPRIITEMAHSTTGIDIHPGAQIGEYFSIDHGTGVVIGETCIIGNHVRLYQGVTLGAKSFVLDEKGKPINLPRHPILEDNVIVYSNSTILGRITIGHDSILGGNVWQTNSVPPHSRILQKKAVSSSFIDGSGI